MTGIIDDDPVLKRIGKKIPPKEFYLSKNLPKDFDSRPQFTKKISITTRSRNAETIAFNKIRTLAKNLSYHNIFYKNYSSANPDFMKGTDRKPKDYNIEAILFN